MASPENNVQDLLMRLTAEELDSIMSYLDIKTLPGYRPKQNLSQEELEAGFRSLRAKGLITAGADDNLLANQAFLRFLEVAATSRKVLNIETLIAGQNVHQFFYIIPGLAILHNHAGDGVHNFRSFNSAEDLLNGIASALLLSEQSKTLGQALDLDKATFDEIRQLAKEDAGRAYAIGARFNINSLRALVQPDFSHVVSYLLAPEGAGFTVHDACLVLGSERHYWLVQVGENQNMQVIPSATMSILERVSQMLLQ